MTEDDNNILSDLWIKKEKKLLERLLPDSFTDKKAVTFRWDRLRAKEDELKKAKCKYKLFKSIKSDEELAYEMHSAGTPELVFSLIIAQLMDEDSIISSNVAYSTSEWVRTKNPAWLDSAIIMCKESAIEPPAALFDQMAVAAQVRFSGKLPRAKDYKDVEKEKVFETVFMWIFKLINFCNLSQEKAVERATMTLMTTFPDFQLKASSLDKYYGKWATRDCKVEKLKAKLSEPQQRPSGWTKQEQDYFIKHLQEMPISKYPVLKGVRRI